MFREGPFSFGLHLSAFVPLPSISGTVPQTGLDPFSGEEHKRLRSLSVKEAFNDSPIYVILTDSPTLVSEDMINSQKVDMVRMGSYSLCRVHALNAMLALSFKLGEE